MLAPATIQARMRTISAVEDLVVPLDLIDVSATIVHRDLTHASPADESRATLRQ